MIVTSTVWSAATLVETEGVAESDSDAEDEADDDVDGDVLLDSEDVLVLVVESPFSPS